MAQSLCRDAFCLFYDAQTKTVKALNGSGRSPAKLTIDHVRSQGVTGNSIPGTNLNSVTVPGRWHRQTSGVVADIIWHSGCAAAWVDTVEKLGSGKLSVADILEPAIRLAEGGYVSRLSTIVTS